MSRAVEERRYREHDEPVPGFRLTKYLGAGAFGEVWKARSSGGVDVAMKILYRIDRKHGHKAYRALQLVKNIQHSNLVPIHAFWLKDEHGNILDDDVAPDFAAESTMPSEVMPEVSDLTHTLAPDTSDLDELRSSPGAASRPAELIIAMGLATESLFDCMERHQKERKPGIPRDELLEYMEGAAKGLDFLNVQHGTIHGDVKPQNIMLTGGQGQVSDFDLARNLSDTRATTTKAYTLAYVAPEVFTRGEPSSTSDQYALAISYCELLTGHLPYVAETVEAVMGAKHTGRLDLSRLRKRDRQVIEKATSAKPEKRYRNSSDMVRELRGAGAGAGTRLLKRAAVLLGLLTLALGAWALPVWRGYDLWSVLLRVPAEVRERDVMASLQSVLDDPSARDEFAIAGVLDSATELAKSAPERDWSSLAKPLTGVLDLLLSRAAGRLETEPKIAATMFEQARTRLQDPALASLVDDDAAILEQAELGLARAKILSGDPVDSLQPQIANWMATASSRNDATHTIVLAVCCLAQDRQSHDALARDMLTSLADLIQQSPAQDVQQLAALTQQERALLQDLVDRVNRAWIEQGDQLTSQDATQQQRLAVITGGDSELLNHIRTARHALASWQQDHQPQALADAAASLDAAEQRLAQGGGRAPGAWRSALQQQLADLREVLEVVRSLSDSSVSARSVLDRVPRAAEIARTRAIGPDVYQALMKRVEEEALGEPTSVPEDELLDVSAVAQVIATSAGGTSNGGLDTASLQARLAGVQVVGSIFTSTPTTVELAKLCDQFLAGAAPADEPDLLTQLVRLVHAECRVLQHTSTVTSPLTQDEITSLRSAIQAVNAGPQRFHDYCPVLEALVLSTDPVAADPVAAAQVIVRKLGPPQVDSVLKVREDRFRCVASIVHQAGRITLGSSTAAPSQAQQFFSFQVAPDAVETGYELLSYYYNQLQQTEDREANRLLALAAFFRQPPATPDLPLAARVSDRLIAEDAADPLLLLINAKSHQADTERADESLARALQSYGRLASLYSNRVDSTQWPMSPAEQYELVVRESLTYFNGFSNWRERAEAVAQAPETWSQLDAATQSVLQDVARIEAARARALTDDPLLADSLAGSTAGASDEQILAILERACALDPTNVKHLINSALTLLRIPRPVDEELAALRQIAQRAKEIDQRDAGGDILDGHCRLIEARLIKSKTTRATTLEQALASFEAAHEKIGRDAAINEIYRFPVLLGIADANVQLANAVASTERDRIAKCLNDAQVAAQAAAELKQERSRVLLVWGNALEDQAWLLHNTDQYVAAIEKFLEARKAAQDNVQEEVESKACVNIGRSVYRLLLANGKDSVSVRTDGSQLDIDLATAIDEYLQTGIGLTPDLPAVQAENYVYQARIRRLRGVREPSWEKQHEQLTAADQCYQQCVKLARQANVPEWMEYQVQWAQNSVDLWRIAGQQTGTDPQTATRYRSEAESRVDQLLSELPAGPNLLAGHEAQIGLACIRLLMFIEDPPAELRPRLDKLVASLAEPGVKCHLLLLQTQYRFNQSVDKTAWDASRADVLRDLEAARRAVADITNDADKLKLWTARVEGQAAMIERKEYLLAPAGSQARKTKALSALEKLNHAITLLDTAQDPHATGDAVCLRYLTGDVTRSLLTDTRFKEKFPADTCTKLKSSALNALAGIKPQAWTARQAFLNSVMLPTVDWDWGSDELDIMFLADGSPTRADVGTSLIRKIQSIACK